MNIERTVAALTFVINELAQEMNKMRELLDEITSVNEPEEDENGDLVIDFCPEEEDEPDFPDGTGESAIDWLEEFGISDNEEQW